MYISTLRSLCPCDRRRSTDSRRLPRGRCTDQPVCGYRFSDRKLWPEEISAATRTLDRISAGDFNERLCWSSIHCSLQLAAGGVDCRGPRGPGGECGNAAVVSTCGGRRLRLPVWAGGSRCPGRGSRRSGCLGLLPEAAPVLRAHAGLVVHPPSRTYSKVTYSRLLSGASRMAESSAAMFTLRVIGMWRCDLVVRGVQG